MQHKICGGTSQASSCASGAVSRQPGTRPRAPGTGPPTSISPRHRPGRRPSHTDGGARCENPLIGAEGSSRSLFLPRPWVTRFSPRSALWPPHHGVRRVGVPICGASFEAAASRPRALRGITRPIVATGTTWFRLYIGRKLDLLQAAMAASSLPQRSSAPSAHIRCRMAARLRATAIRAPCHAAGAQGRPSSAAVQQRMGGLVKGGPGQFVAAAADAVLHLGLPARAAPSVSGRDGPHVARASEAVGRIEVARPTPRTATEPCRSCGLRAGRSPS